MTSSSTFFFPNNTPSLELRHLLRTDHDAFSLSEAQTSVTVFLKKEHRQDFIASLRRIADQLEQGLPNAQN